MPVPQGRGDAGRYLCEREGEIDQKRHAIGDGRPAALAYRRGFRWISQVTIILAALVLITLAWTAAHEAIRVHRTEALARVRMETLGTALAIEEQLRRELLTLAQTLHILEYVWELDPTHFDLATWYSHVGVLSDVSLQLFISDARGIVRSSSAPRSSELTLVAATISGMRKLCRQMTARCSSAPSRRVRSPTYGRSTWSADWTIRTALLPA